MARPGSWAAGFDWSSWHDDFERWADAVRAGWVSQATADAGLRRGDRPPDCLAAGVAYEAAHRGWGPAWWRQGGVNVAGPAVGSSQWVHQWSQAAASWRRQQAPGPTRMPVDSFFRSDVPPHAPDGAVECACLIRRVAWARLDAEWAEPCCARECCTKPGKAAIMVSQTEMAKLRREVLRDDARCARCGEPVAAHQLGYECVGQDVLEGRKIREWDRRIGRRW